jgi:GTP-binding protein
MTDIRNIAIIAHIDHGKTSLLDALMKATAVFEDHEEIPERIMDHNDQEKERGITIFSKHTSLYYKGTKINIIDTPGHADFSGEVERVLGMVDTVLLLVDAKEGPMPQTRYVLKKALAKGLCPILVINKIDRPNCDPDLAVDKTFDLFVELEANDKQMDFPHCYASAIKGFAKKEVHDESDNMNPLLDLILEKVPPPKGDPSAPFLMQSATVTYDKYVGRQATGQILQGKIALHDEVIHIDAKGTQKRRKITRIQGYLGLDKIEQKEAQCGDIVSLAGIEDVLVGDTLCSPEKIKVLPAIEIEEPTMSVNIMVNSSPFSGKDGKHLTMNKIRDRLVKEREANISLVIDLENENQESIPVAGRGELHLSVLIESMRREGYEMSISKPQVIIKEEKGIKLEPIERVYIEVPEEYSGQIIEELSKRKGEMQSLSTNDKGISQLEFLIPTRGLMGWRGNFLTKTRGLGILTSIFEKFAPHMGEIVKRKEGALVSMVQGKTNAYACFNLQSRGTLFVSPSEEVYEGMIVGENSRANDLVVNPVKGKQLTNVRASGSDEMIQLAPARKLTLEQAIDFLNEDELVEVTPHFIRLRKKHLKETDRKRAKT